MVSFYAENSYAENVMTTLDQMRKGLKLILKNNMLKKANY